MQNGTLKAALAVFFMSTPAMGSDARLPIVVQCEDAPQEICDALSAALVEKAPKRELLSTQAAEASGNALVIRLDLTRNDTSVLEGRLVWTSGDSEPVEGPLVEVSVLDAPLTDRARRNFADGLLTASQLPL